MIEPILLLLAPMLLGTQLVLTLVLTKGEICPGQRGRVHKLLPAIGVLWLAIASTNMFAFIVAAPVFYFFSKVQTKKTRDKGPIWMLYIADGFALAYVVNQLFIFPSIPALVSWLINVSLLGAIFSNLLLLIARSRLDAFHKILPITGIVSGIALAILVALQVIGLNENALFSLQTEVLLGLALLIVGLLIWPLHMMTRQSINKIQLSMTLMVLLLSSASLYPLLLLS
ncbi:hypothetical protein [Vibrio algarum]|uniref:Uncharacterized protein n=1 Tax=Vibrio algarum TaxID=3020714 RepID=A0ABT4YRI6_9VIBR|nr:hypothetical protein [Vibrio sp. KJ40-1]MDB1124022.1 hypothetical protein [Vibrio sp. KJ40-1]